MDIISSVQQMVTSFTYNRMRTPDIAERNYLRTDFGFNKIRSNRWEAQVTYSYTLSRGAVQGTPSSFMTVPQQIEYFLDGYLGTDIRHDVTAGFSWDLPNDPWTTRIGGTAFLESGYPITRTYDNGNYGDYMVEVISLKIPLETMLVLKLGGNSTFYYNKPFPFAKENFGVLLRLRTSQINA